MGVLDQGLGLRLEAAMLLDIPRLFLNSRGRESCVCCEYMDVSEALLFAE